MFFWLAGLPSQKWVCPSMTNISSPSAVLYMAILPSPSCGQFFHHRAAGSSGRTVPEQGPTLGPALERSVLYIDQRFIHVAEQNDRIVVNHDHAAIMRRGRDFEQMRRHRTTQRFADLVHFELQPGLAIDPDHRRQIGDRDIWFLLHDLGDVARLDAVVHRYPALAGNRILEPDVLHRLEDIRVMCSHFRLLNW